MTSSASTKSEAPGERQQEWQAYECAHEHRFAIAPANLTVGRVVKCAVCGTITVKALEGDSGVVVPKAEAESLVWEMGKQKAAAERAREEAEAAAIEAVARYLGDYSTEAEESEEDWQAEAREILAPVLALARESSPTETGGK